MAALAGDQVFMAAVVALHTGETILQTTAIEVVKDIYRYFFPECSGFSSKRLEIRCQSPVYVGYMPYQPMRKPVYYLPGKPLIAYILVILFL